MPLDYPDSGTIHLMSRVVHLHIGAPKTGTTYLQDRLVLNASALARHGVTIPGPRVGRADTFHFRAALDLLDQDWGGASGHAHGAWDAMVKKVGRADGNVVISHEILRRGEARQDRQGHERPRRQRGPHRLLRPRPRPPAPGRLAGVDQAGSQVAVQALPHQGRAWPDLVLQRHGPAAGAVPVGRQAAARARPRRHRPARPRTQRRRAVAALLPGLRHRPVLGAARLRA